MSQARTWIFLFLICLDILSKAPIFLNFLQNIHPWIVIIGEPVFQTEQFLCLLGTNRLTEMVMVAVWWWLGALLLTSLASAAYYVILLTSVPLRDWFLAIAINGTKVTTYTPGTHLTWQHSAGVPGRPQSRGAQPRTGGPQVPQGSTSNKVLFPLLCQSQPGLQIPQDPGAEDHWHCEDIHYALRLHT